jgi:hypothetical protein
VRRGKVLVVGAGEAGKSTLIRALCPEAMNLEVRGRTVAMDHATLTTRGRRLALVGVPGQQRFAPVREALARGTAAAIWVHRAGSGVDPDSAELVAQLAAKGVPYVVVINSEGPPQGHDGWSQPTSCPAPRALVAGDLLSSPAFVGHVERVLWEMVGEVLGNQKGE